MTTMAYNNNSDNQRRELPPTITTLDLDNVSITLPRKSKYGKMAAYWCLGNSMSNTDVIFQLCPDSAGMSVIFPPSKFHAQAEEVDKYGMVLNVTNPHTIDALAALDEKALKFFMDNRAIFFEKYYTDDMIRHKVFCPIVKPVDLANGYGARIAVKISQDASSRHPVEVFTYNANENTMSPTHFKDIRKGDDVVPIVSIGGMWCLSGRTCGYSLEACRILVIPNHIANGTGFVMGSGLPTPTLVYPTVDSIHVRTRIDPVSMDECK
jgi:hypothetical protein